MMLVRLLVFCAIVVVCKSDIPPTEEYPHSAILNADGKVKLYWKFDDVYITFEVHGATTGWIGIGFSPNGGMEGADMIVGWIVDGKVTITDRHGVESSVPPLDPEQNIELLDGMESDGWTLIKFKRQRAACEPEYDFPITSNTIKVIYAFGATEPSDGSDLEFSHYHGDNRGPKSLILLELSGDDEANFPEGETHMTFDLLNDEFEIPSETTYYNCRLHKLPEFTEKQHVVKVEPVIQPGNELFVHHIVVNECTGDINESQSVGTDIRCYGSNMPPDFTSCSYALHSWTIGGTAMYYPKNAGFPLGDIDSPRYVVVETHYDNPKALSGVVDSSGLRFTYTNQTRKFDAGVLATGIAVSGVLHLIPPNAESFISYGECSANCLEQSMKHGENDKLNAFGVILHSHLLGSGLTLRHIRDKVELPYLARDSSYDFNYQETRKLLEEREILPGDSLQLACDYKTKDVRTEMSVGGLTIQKEMCQAFIYYYPKTSATYCVTNPLITDFMSYFGISKAEYINGTGGIYQDIHDVLITEPEELAGQTFAEYLNSMTWNDETNKELEDTFRNMTRIQFCSGPQSFPGVELVIPAPVIDVPHVEELPICYDNTSASTMLSTLEGEMETTTSGTTKLGLSCYWLSLVLILFAMVSIR